MKAMSKFSSLIEHSIVLSVLQQVDMTSFVQNLSKVNKFVFAFGISPYLLNQKTNKFECSVLTLIYSFTYFMCISIALIYMIFAYYLADDYMFQSTFGILTLLQQATIMTIFYSIMFNLLRKRHDHANFLNNLIQLDSNLGKFYTNKIYGNELVSLYRQIIFVVCFNAVACIVNSIKDRNRMTNYEHVWNTVQFFQTISITLVAYYIRLFAMILNQRCIPIFEKLNSTVSDVRYAKNSRLLISEVMNCFEAFDEVMYLKKELSEIFGIQLLLNSAFDFMMLTFSVFGLLYFQAQNLTFLYYIFVYNGPHAIKCVLLVLALDTLANQV